MTPELWLPGLVLFVVAALLENWLVVLIALVAVFNAWVLAQSGDYRGWS